MKTIPSLFVSHGAPDILLSKPVAADAMRAFADRLPLPRAIVIVSAHWIDNPIGVTAGASLPTIHDFQGFPPMLYGMDYPATGDDELSSEIARCLNEVGLTCRLEERRGLDHGAWVPLKIMYPKAQVSIVQVSLPIGPFEQLVSLGTSLRPLRAKGVLVIGSGGSVHNLGALRHNGGAEEWAVQFEHWLLDTVEGNHFDHLITPSRFPGAFGVAHPTTEHYAPLVVAWAAANPDYPGRRIHHSFTYGSLGMSCFEFGNQAT